VKDLTQGSIPRHLIELASFIAVSMVVQTLYFLVDLYFVSSLGGPAIAGVGLAGNLMMVILALTQMLGVGTTSLIAQAAGRRDPSDAQSVFDQSCLLSVLLGFAFLLCGLLFQDAYCRWLSADAATLAAAKGYLKYLVPAFALQFALVSMSSALRATGVVKPTMVVQVLTVAINAILAPVLIVGWGTGLAMGTEGAGLATLIALIAGVAALSIYFIKHATFVRFSKAAFTARIEIWKRLIAIGLPSGGEFLIMAIYSAFVYSIIRDQGADAQAGFGVGVRLMQSLFLPVMAVSFAASPLAAQNFGAMKADRVRQTFRSAAIMAAGLMSVMTILCHLSPESMVKIFTSDPPVITYATDYLRILSWGFVAFGLTFTSSAMFQAIGNAWPALLSSVLRLLIFVFPALWLSHRTGFVLTHLWYLAVSAGTAQCLFSLALLRREFARRLDFQNPIR
jgi:putative MATE family efflux protein